MSRRAFLRRLGGIALLAGVGGTAVGAAVWQALVRLGSGQASEPIGLSFATPLLRTDLAPD